MKTVRPKATPYGRGPGFGIHLRGARGRPSMKAVRPWDPLEAIGGYTCQGLAAL